jgi:hypothetical protein
MGKYHTLGPNTADASTGGGTVNALFVCANVGKASTREAISTVILFSKFIRKQLCFFTSSEQHYQLAAKVEQVLLAKKKNANKSKRFTN